MTSSVAHLKDAINEVRLNPAAIQRKVFETLEQTSSGELDVVDPTNPFVFLLEASSVLTSAQMEEAENLTRRLYPSMALTEDELYLHMSDRDYIGRFSSPSRTSFKLLFNKEELVKRAVAVEGSDVRKLVIPRNTEFRVSDYTFTMEYPIELRVMGHGGLQVVYDVSKPSPLQTLESNVVDWRVVKLKGDDYVQVTIPVNQFKVTPFYAHINKSTNYTKAISLEDPFYYCRIYRARSGGRWEEIKTTHTDQVFDPNTPTALLKVYDERLLVTIPQVYISNGTLDKELRIDVYTTKGPLQLILDSYEINAFTANWRDIGKESSQFSSPLNVFTSMAVYSDDIVSGGTKGLTFDELRSRVIDNALGNAQLPITGAQLSARLANMGYRAIKDVDNVTNRIYLATRRLPQPENENTQGGAACTIGTIQGSYDDIIRYQGVIDNGKRLTVTPDTLFYRDNGVTRFLPNNRRSEIQQLSDGAKATAINESRLVITPFHYVLDSNGSYFDCRTYYLDNPTIESREYIEENRSFSLHIVTDSVGVFKKPTGYVLQLTVITGERMDGLADGEFVPQISYRPPNEQRDVFLNGRLIRRVDNRWTFEFDLSTRFDLTADHHLMMDSFTMYPDEVRPYRADLLTRLNLVYYLPNRLAPTTPEKLRYRGAEFLVGDGFTGVSHEIIGIKFGDWLEGFWENSRTVVGGASYLTYKENVEAVYEQNVYKRDPITGTIEVRLNDEGEVEYEILHRKGDPVLDEEGEPLLSHRAGDPVLDENGDPILEHERKLIREWDMFLFDGRYRFATRESDVGYLKEIPKTILSWLRNDLATFRNWALEQTEIYLYPQKTLGTAEAVVGEGEARRVDLEQSFTVSYYLSYDKYNDPFVRDTLSHLAKQTIASTLTLQQIRRNEIISKITAQAGEDIIAVNVEGLGGVENYDALTLKQDVERCAIRKRLQQGLDGDFEVVDDVVINFIRHTEMV